MLRDTLLLSESSGWTNFAQSTDELINHNQFETDAGYKNIFFFTTMLHATIHMVAGSTTKRSRIVKL